MINSNLSSEIVVSFVIDFLMEYCVFNFIVALYFINLALLTTHRVEKCPFLLHL